MPSLPYAPGTNLTPSRHLPPKPARTTIHADAVLAEPKRVIVTKKPKLEDIHTPAGLARLQSQRSAPSGTEDEFKNKDKTAADTNALGYCHCMQNLDGKMVKFCGAKCEKP